MFDGKKWIKTNVFYEQILIYISVKNEQTVYLTNKFDRKRYPIIYRYINISFSEHIFSLFNSKTEDWARK